MAEFIVRRARLDEAEALSELSIRAKASWGYDDEFMARCRDELTITPEKMGAWVIWVAECGGDVVGLAALAAGRTDAELEEFMVDPGFQGRGVGARLMDVVLDECRSRGFKSIGLDADPHAEPIYLKFGFSTVGQSQSGSIPGRVLPRMVRSI